MLLLFLLSLAAPVFCQSPMNFTGHKLLALFPSNEREIEFLRGLAESKEVDAWNTPAALYEKMNIRVSSEVAKQLESELKSKGVDFYVVTDNIQKWIDEEREENPIDDELAGRQENFQLDVYHSFEATAAAGAMFLSAISMDANACKGGRTFWDRVCQIPVFWRGSSFGMDAVPPISAYIDSVGQRYGGLAQVQHIGTTFEGNPLKGLKIGTPGANKPSIWIDSGIHAREWVAPATSLYIIEQLVKGYDTDPEIRQLMDTFDWHIFPVVNPDGYKYTWTYNRMWRKNRAPSTTFNPFCRGTDPNRNFDAGFGGSGTSGDPCSEIYRGPTAFSEAESRAVRDGVQRIGSSLKAFITVHSYSQLWMTPYGTSRDYPPDYADHLKALTAMCSAIQNVHGQYYKYGTIANTIYPAAGSSVDWAYAGARIKYSFAAELRDTGRQGFMLSNTQIIPTAEENFAGIKVLANIIKSEL